MADPLPVCGEVVLLVLQRKREGRATKGRDGAELSPSLGPHEAPGLEIWVGAPRLGLLTLDPPQGDWVSRGSGFGAYLVGPDLVLKVLSPR